VAVGDRVEFEVLGPVSIRVGEQRIAVPGARQRVVLALLLLRRRDVVTVNELVDAVWPEEPPATARRQIQNAVSAIRGVLSHHGAAELLRSERDGYRLFVEPDLIDACRFEAAVAEAVGVMRAGRPHDAVAQLRRALALWQGAPFGGLGSVYLRAQAARLDELRLTAIEERVECELVTGGHLMVPELTGLVAEHPLRGRLVAALMLALHRAGQTAEALAVYQRAEQMFDEELGLDPGVEVRRMRDAIVCDDPAITAPEQTTAATPVPHPPTQLPARPAVFVGQADHVHRLAAVLARIGSGASIVVVTGFATVGKSAFALYGARHVLDRIHDQLHADLHGFDARLPPARPTDVVRRFPDDLSMRPECFPLDPYGPVALLGTALGNQQALIVLDNAHDAEQVRHLLPGVVAVEHPTPSRSPPRRHASASSRGSAATRSRRSRTQ
jgi:DNA-binding SARP family transcriptional activator